MSGPADIDALCRLARALVEHVLERTAKPHGDMPSRYAVSAAEVVRILREHVPQVDRVACDRRLADAEAGLQARVDDASGRLARLAAIFELDALEVHVLAAVAAPDLDPAIERLYAYAWDDFTRKRPDLGFVIRLVAAGDPARESYVLDRLDDRGSLRRHRLLVVENPDTAWTTRPVRVADRVLAYLRGHDPIDESVADVVRLDRWPRALSEIVLPTAIVDRVRRALASRGARVVLAGRAGTGRGTLVEAIAAAHHGSAMRVDLAALLLEPRTLAERLAAALREAALRGATCILEADELDGEVSATLAARVGAAVAAAVVPVVFTAPARTAWLAAALGDLTEIDVPPPTFEERARLWRAAVSPNVRLADDDALETVAGRYGFTGGTIARAASRAVRAAELRDPDAPTLELDDLGDAARLAFSHRLGAIAQRIPAGFSWDDLVLPADTLAQLREVVSFARERPFLLETWGLARKLPYGRGVSAILAGPPGTGKTMVAQLLAKELGYDLYRIDLSQVVNKYIGETEKNLARIFEEAESSHAVLFFDEADALFAKRTAVQSSTDRYANLEVNYLLQRMETYDGVTLLATNLEQGLDEAFKRRVRFAVQFELPELEERKRLWRSMFPPQLPLAPDIDWTTLASRFEMAGGYIKKAAVRAALYAASARPRRAVTHGDLIEAAQREYREMGRVTYGGDKAR